MLTQEAPTGDAINCVTLRYDVGSSGGLELCQCMDQLSGQATGETAELFCRAAQAPYRAAKVHSTEKIDPDAASSGRA